MAADQAAGLTLKVDTSQVKSANTQLDEFTTKAGTAEQATKKFNTENAKTGKTGKEAAAGLKDQATQTEKISTGMSKQEVLAQRLGTSTKNLGFASRNAALQMQDVVVSLDMGIPVYRVMLQQLPQITGAFGGLGNTLRYFAGVLGPVGLALTAVAATLGAGAAIISRSERQMSSLNRTLTLTSNISGLTADSILRMAENAEALGKSFNGTRDTVQALAAAGVKAGADFGKLADVVQNFAKASGQPIEDVVSQIAKLSSDPVGGLRALEGQYHSVTEAQIQSVKALVDQGRQTEAVARANTIAATSFAEMSASVKSNAGTLERAMGSVTRAAKSMWDAILDVGRPESANRKEMEVRETLQQRVTAYNAEMKAISEQGGKATEAQRARLAVLNDEINTLNGQLATFGKTAAAKRDEAKAREDSAKAQEKENQNTRTAVSLADRYATAADKRKKAMDELKTALASGAINQKQYLEYEKQINEQYKDPAVKKAAAVRVDAGVKMLEMARSELAQLKEAGKQITANAADETRATRAQAALNKLNADNAELVAAAKTRALTAAEKQTMAEYAATKEVRQQIVEEAKRQDALEKSVKSHAQVNAYLKNQDAELSAIQQGYALSTREASNLREELQLIDRLQRAGASSTDVTAAVAKLREVQAAQSGANATLFDGFSSGLNESVDEMGTAYSQMKDLTKFTFNAMTDAMTGFFTTGKLDAKSMVSSILGELVRLATSSAFKSIVSAFGGKTTGGSLFESLFSAFTANANGGAYAGGNLSAYSGQVVSQPTFFNYGVKKFANGAGLMGEAGPEAIMPLKRGADGKLGVATSGASGGISVSTSVQMASGNATTQVGGTNDPKLAQAFGQQITEAVKAEINKATKPGGILFKR